MLVLGKRLNDTKIPREELLNKVTVCKTTPTDCIEIIRILIECFKIPSIEEAIRYLHFMRVNLSESVKLIDKESGLIYGLLLFGDSTMSSVTPMSYANPTLSCILKNMNQLCGIAFIIDERLRGCGFDKKMLCHNKDFIEQYELVWCGVDKDLNSLNYWLKMGFMRILDTPQAQFLMKII